MLCSKPFSPRVAWRGFARVTRQAPGRGDLCHLRGPGGPVVIGLGRRVALGTCVQSSGTHIRAGNSYSEAELGETVCGGVTWESPGGVCLLSVPGGTITSGKSCGAQLFPGLALLSPHLSFSAVTTQEPREFLLMILKSFTHPGPGGWHTVLINKVLRAYSHTFHLGTPAAAPL